MAVIRVAKDKNFTVMKNIHLKDERLSLKAVGLMCWMLSLPDDWDYSVAGIASCRKEGRDAVRGALKELEDTGYLTIDKKHDEQGKFVTEYILREDPLQKNRYGKTATEKPTQINTNKTSTKNKTGSKKEKNRRQSYEDIINSLVDDTKVKEALLDYLQMRMMQKKAPTNKAVILLVNSLKIISQDPVEQVKIVEQATKGNYMDFQPIKRSKSKAITGSKVKKEAVSIPVTKEDKAKKLDGSYIVY